MKVDGLTAWKTAASEKRFRWAHDLGAFSQQIYPVAYAGKFEIAASDKFFCIGSCFARNIEEHLIYRGVSVLSRRLHNPRTEWSARPNGIVNKFTTHSMLNELRWLLDPPAVTSAFFTETSAGWTDLQLSPGSKSVALERAIERRLYLIHDYFSRIRGADVIVITLGLNEVWKDNLSGLYLNAAPGFSEVKAHPDRYSFEVTGVASNVEDLRQIYTLLKRLNPAAKVIVTISPVPLELTFSGDDPAVANTRSKSVLRVAADELANSHDDVDYFPSYEMASMAPRSEAYGPDCRHVADAAVGAIIGRFLRAHRLEGPPAETFNEMGYLAANPDVDESVRRGEIDSGYHHWLAVGRKECRALMPKSGPTAKMIKAGQVSAEAT